MGVKTFAIVIAFSIFILVLELIRRQKMTFKYSLAWLSASLTVVFFALNESVLFGLAKWVGFQLPSNFIFFSLLVFFVLLTLRLTLYINEQNTKTEKLAQAIGILEYKLQGHLEGKNLNTPDKKD
jgi:hypothetical protein